MKTKSFILLLCAVLYGLAVRGANIEFADANVKALCIQNWDTNGDGELSETEAAAVTDLGGVFQSNSSITSFNELKYFTGLKRIDNKNFYECSSLTSIVIPNSVTSIGSYDFYGCSSLESIQVAAGNTVYDSRNNCNAIIESNSNTLIVGCKKTIIPDNVTSIGSIAFSGCTSLTSIEIPSSVTTIGNRAFYGCTGLTSIVIPNSVTIIGQEAFRVCRGLTSIIIPSSVTTIRRFTFAGCSGLTSIEIPNSVTTIGTGAFSGCSGLTSIVIPNSVTSIASSAFYECKALSYLVIPNSITNILHRAFYNCSGLDAVISESEQPATLESSVFFGCKNATLYVPYGCSGAYSSWAAYFKYVKEMPATRPNTPIDSDSPAIKFADGNVKALCVVNWDTDHDWELSEAEAAAVTDLGYVFSNNSSITSFNELQYFTGLTKIGDYAFFNCWYLSSIEIPNSVTSISNSAFQVCISLTSIEIPNSVTNIGNSAFWLCI